MEQEEQNTGSAQVSELCAAEYVRMSTEHQQYSTQNQADKIREYAARRGIRIVRTYTDEGKSGLNIGGRSGLQKLIRDVESGQTDFKIILVYDVSRWGRFQNADESAYYEYLCHRAGIQVAWLDRCEVLSVLSGRGSAACNLGAQVCESAHMSHPQFP